MACKTDKRRKSFFPNIFRVKEKKASRECVDPFDRSGTISASIQREEPLDLTGTYSASIRNDIPFDPIGSPIFSSPSTPFFIKGFSGKDSSSNLARMAFNNLSSAIHNVSGTQDLRIFVATWNVGGKSPRVDLNLNNLLPNDDQSDIYVLGFQEIVPLNAGNVLVIEDSEPAVKWLGLINKALNRPSESEYYATKHAPSSRADTSRQAFSTKSVYRDSKSPSLFFQKSSLKAVKRSLKGENGRRFKTCNCPSEVVRKSYRDSCFRCPQSYASTNDSSEEEEEEASSTMTDISSAISTTNNHLSHLASGEKEGDELRRNSDVIEILKNTQFQRICKAPNRRIPERILEHDRVIWVGDLNYRIALSYTETRNLLSNNDWDALFEKDQLKIEREAGRVFRGWNEGKIYFAPTYKYSNNSDAYAGETVTSKKKRRTPAWCDRILWHGDGIMQLFYIRGESRFSDHRPVCASFIVVVELPDSRLRNGMLSANMKVGVEELLPQSDSFSSM